MNRLLRNNSGAAAVELAIILPLLLVLVFGIIEFGIILYNKAMLTNASREGARAGIVFTRDPSGASIESRVNDAVDNFAANLISFGGTPAISRSVTYPEGVESGRPLRVALQYTYTFLVLPRLSEGLTASLSLDATTVMRLE